jgi:hypothetical protein
LNIFISLTFKKVINEVVRAIFFILLRLSSEFSVMGIKHKDPKTGIRIKHQGYLNIVISLTIELQGN